MLPSDWPPAVPVPDQGTLFTAFANPDGTAGALWHVRSSSGKVRRQYGKLMTAAGFKAGEWFSQGAMTGYRCHGHGLQVQVGVLEVDGVTSLDVSVQPS